MGKVSLPTKSGTLVAMCDDEVEDLTLEMLQVVAGFEGRGRGLANGVRVQFGWSELTLKHVDGEIVVHEPDFAEDPEGGLRDDVTCTVTVSAAMAGTVQAVGVVPVDLRFDDALAIAPGCLEEPDLYLLRSAPRGENSGWFIGPANAPPGSEEAGAEFEGRYVWELLHERPALLAALALPPGYLVLFSGDEMVSVSPPEGEGENPDAAGGAPAE
ncbi:hypothetical protein [Fimbriiglobus ruber]|uniref:Imm33-like domain-containing protein n=1 Tax=Fimbriiglobus ruber TaxID=1908690 RepID=A0A225DUV4_9BACT|nr:hypothetical protein [Fimbriiglobus ruber]OWK42308.1 hypothetical protein FRUB_04386 [Fimbriiglobus ruber]